MPVHPRTEDRSQTRAQDLVARMRQQMEGTAGTRGDEARPAAEQARVRREVDPAQQRGARQTAVGRERGRAEQGEVAAPERAAARGLSTDLRRGARGPEVEALQRALNAKGAKLDVDGKLGPLTERALKDFQGQNGLPQDGVANRGTRQALGNESAQRITPAQAEAHQPRGARAPRGTGEPTGARQPTGREPAGGRDPSGRVSDVGSSARPGSSAERLASAAEAEARRMNSVGRCALGVNNALQRAGLSTERGHAYQKAEQLARDADFREVNVSRDQLANLPRGAVVVWGRSGAKPYGHVSVALGGGREASDHIQRQMTGGRYGTDFGRGPDPQGRQFRVFIPVR